MPGVLNLMRRTLSRVLLHKPSNPNVSCTIGAKVMDVVLGIPTPCSSPSSQREANRVNDSYCTVDPIDGSGSQKSYFSPALEERSIKIVKGVCFASHCPPVPPVINVQNVAVWEAVCKMQKFWQVWLSLGSNPMVVPILQEGYNLPFKMRLHLTRSPLGVSGYANPLKNSCLKEALQSLLQKKGSRKDCGSILTGFLQPVVSSPKASKPVETYFRPKHLQLVPEGGHFQNGNTTDHQTLLAARRVENFPGLQQCLLSHSHESQAKEVFKVSPKQSNLSIHSSTFWPSDGSVRVHEVFKGSETYGPGKRYENPPVPRRLISQNPVSGNLLTTYPDPFGTVPRSG